MTLHTTSDGQITYEGLPVVNQEEVRAFICTKYAIAAIIPSVTYELPDDEFEAKKYKTCDSDVRTMEEMMSGVSLKEKPLVPGKLVSVAILRKPVSEEGEKKTYTGMKDTVSGAIKQSGENNKGLGESSESQEQLWKEVFITAHHCSSLEDFKKKMDNITITRKP